MKKTPKILEPDLDSFGADITPLFSVEPIWGESVNQEGLLSYLQRLTSRHMMSWAPMARILAGEMQLNEDHLRDYRWTEDARTLNSYSKTAWEASEGISKLTGIPEISRLTLSHLRGYFAANGLGAIKRRPEWCVECWRGMHDHGDVYSPLFWSIKGVTYCIEHDCVLSYHCPHCNSEQHHIRDTYRVTFCDYCDKDLIGKISQKLSYSDEILRLIARSYSKRAIELTDTSAFPNKDRATNRVVENIDRILLIHPKITSQRKLSAMSGLSADTFGRWKRLGNKPTLNNYLALCTALNLDARKLATKLLDEEEISRINVRDVSPFCHSAVRDPNRLNADQTRVILSRLIKNKQVKSLAEASRAMGVSRSLLQYRHPEICKRLIERHGRPLISRSHLYRFIVKLGIEVLLLRNEPPTKRGLERVTGCQFLFFSRDLRKYYEEEIAKLDR